MGEGKRDKARQKNSKLILEICTEGEKELESKAEEERTKRGD